MEGGNNLRKKRKNKRKEKRVEGARGGGRKLEAKEPMFDYFLK